MRRQRIYLLDAHPCDAVAVAEIERGLDSLDQDVVRLVIPPGTLDGSDDALAEILNQVRSDDAPQSGPPCSRVLLGCGLQGSLALWLCALDSERPREFSVGRASITLDEPDPDFPHVFDGVIAFHPFLGFDFRVPGGQGPNAWWRSVQFRFFKSRIGAVLAGWFPAPDLRPYGCLTNRRISWRTLVRSVLSFTVTENLPALKRPTVIGIDTQGGFDRIQLQLSVLNIAVSVRDCPDDPDSCLQATLRAVDSLQ